MTLSNLSSLDECLDGSVKWFYLRTNASAQFSGGQMDVQASGFGAFVTSNERNIFEADTRSFEDGTALVTEGVRSQRGKSHSLPDAFDDLVKGSHRERAAWIPCRFRQKNRSEIVSIVCRN